MIEDEVFGRLLHADAPWRHRSIRGIEIAIAIEQTAIETLARPEAMVHAKRRRVFRLIGLGIECRKREQGVRSGCRSARKPAEEWCDRLSARRALAAPAPDRFS